MSEQEGSEGMRMPTPWRLGKWGGSFIGVVLWSGNFYHYPQQLGTARFLGERGASYLCMCDGVGLKGKWFQQFIV